MNDKDNVKEEVRKVDSPLFLAILRNESANEILTIIDRNPSAVRQRGTNGNYPLHQACLYDDGRDSRNLIVMKLLDLFPQAAQEKQMYGYRVDHYPLHVACLKLSDDVILKLLDAYPDAAQIHYKGKCIGYPLHIAFYRGRSEDVIMKLMEVYPEAAAREMRVVFDDNDHDYDDDCYYDDMYPLHYACKAGLSVRVIRKLLEIYPGALHQRLDGSFWSYDGYPLDWAITYNQSVDVVKLLVMTDPSILQQVDDHSCTPFHNACLTNRAEVVECLLQFPNLPINARAKSGRTPLHHACIPNGLEMEAAFAMMLEHPDIDVNTFDKDGASVLHSIILNRKFNLIHLLLDHPCIMIDQKDNTNQTPLDLIKEQIIELTNGDNDYNQKADLPRLMEMRNLLQDFPKKRKWQSYEYFHQKLEDWSSVK